MERFDCLSTMLYYKMNAIIGDRELVSIRRGYFDIKDTMNNSLHDLFRVMVSGSRREGLDMAGSDYDFMCWFPNIYVIFDTTQSHYYNAAKNTLILAEQGLTRPGFAFLRLLHQACTQHVLFTLPSYISLHNHTYISSSRHRQSITQSLRAAKDFDFHVHGPCTSGCMDGLEMDLAFCFPSLHWPPQAFSWLQRCQRLRWPRPSVLQDIITQCGCHFVAIGAKQSIFENVEWRLSFSQAEQKLVYSFNQCQLLVYGLLKLFLKEVLNSGIPENQKLLCSYFMKNALFWQIQDDILTHWSVHNFLLCFWNCFKLLIKWVNCQYCPNFFVPENNMFFPKITGSDQQRLLSQLLGFYNEGVVCLMRCSSIKRQIISAIFCPRHTLNLSYELHLSVIKKDVALRNCLAVQSHMKSYTYEDQIKCIYLIRMRFRSSSSKAHHLFLYSHVIHHCQMLALSRQITHIHSIGNVEKYTLNKQSLNLMKQTSRLGCLTDVIYLAVYYYNDGRYTHALCLLQEIKRKLYRPYVMYTTPYPDNYIQAMGGKSLSTKIKKAFASDICIAHYANFSGLEFELRVLEQFSRNVITQHLVMHLVISPFVFVHFLIFLCHHHLHSTQQQQALHELHTLVHNNDVKYISFKSQSTAWHLLGICYQQNKNPRQALQCFRKSLTTDNQYGKYPLQIATHYRIRSIERQLVQQQIIEPPLD